MRGLVREIFEDKTRLKVLHACQQDILALVGCLGIQPQGIFDTAGMDIYFQQRLLYQQLEQHHITP
jgi:ribonuclease D